MFTRRYHRRVVAASVPAVALYTPPHTFARMCTLARCTLDRIRISVHMTLTTNGRREVCACAWTARVHCADALNQRKREENAFSGGTRVSSLHMLVDVWTFGGTQREMVISVKSND